MSQDSVSLTPGSGVDIGTVALDSGIEVQQVVVVSTESGEAVETLLAQDDTVRSMGWLIRTLIAEQRLTNLLLAEAFGLTAGLDALRAECFDSVQETA